MIDIGKPLGKNAARIVGMSEETTCDVSPKYFADGDPFAEGRYQRFWMLVDKT